MNPALLLSILAQAATPSKPPAAAPSPPAAAKRADARAVPVLSPEIGGDRRVTLRRPRFEQLA